MKKYITIIIICAFLPMAGSAQINLVLNPSFEQYSVCPTSIDGATYCTNWNTLDSGWRAPDWAHDLDGVPEYCNSCSTYLGCSLPNNAAFYHNTRSGNGMMQLEMFCPNTYHPYQRDYLQGHLMQTLVTGHNYQVTFYTVLEILSGDAVNKIAAYLDDGTIDTTHKPAAVQNQYAPQIVDTAIISDTLNWTKIEGIFAANGTEKLITIGQFADSAHTNFYHVTSSRSIGDNFTWYLVDDVSVIDCDNLPNAGHDTTIMHVGDSVFIGSHEPLLPYTWYKSGSSTAIDSGGGIWVHPAVTTTYILEQKLCGVKRWDTVKVRVYPDTVVSHVGIEQLLSDNLKVYPNPAKTEFTIEGARSCYVTISDITGRVIINAVLTSNKEQMDISALERGIYLVEVFDRVTSVKVMRKVYKE